MPTVLITGAGRGLGLEFARQYAADGWLVIATIRDTRQGAALAAFGKTVEIHQLDVSDLKAIERLAGELGSRAIDVLICNAGINPLRAVPKSEADYRAWEQTMRVNVLAPHALAQAFADRVAASAAGKIVMISSQMGSIARAGAGAVVYRSSKAALNMVSRTLAAELAPRGIVVTAFHPGWVRTDMGGPGAPMAATDSVRALRGLIDTLTPAQSGSFVNVDGTPMPW